MRGKGCAAGAPLSILALLLVPVAAATASERPEASLPELLQDFRTLAPAPEGYPVSNRSVSIGHLDLNFESGTVFPLQTTAGVTLGILFEGAGRFAYRGADAAETKSLLDSAARLHPAPVMTSQSIGDSFKSFLAFFATPEPNSLWVEKDLSNPSARIAADARTRQDFSRIWSHMNRLNLGPDHLAAEGRMNGGSRFLTAEIEADFGTVDYTFDTLRESIEGLFVGATNPKTHGPGMKILNLQELGGGPLAPHGSLYLRDLFLDIDARDPKQGKIQCRESLEVAHDATRVGAFYLFNHRDPSSSDWKSETMPFRLKSVTGPGGVTLPFSHRYHEVLVSLPGAMRKGDLLELTFQYEGDLSDVKESRDGPQVALWSGVWFPVPCGMGPDGFTYVLQIKTARPNLPVASGERVDFVENPAGYQLKVRSRTPVWYLTAVAGPFTATEKEVEGRPIRFYTNRNSTPRSLADFLGNAVRTIQAFIGPLPAQDIQFVQIPLASRASTLPGLIFVSDRELLSSHLFFGSDPRDWSARFIVEMLTSQWAYRAKPKSVHDLWLTEGTRRYVADLATSLLLKPELREQALASQNSLHLSAVLEDCAEGSPLRQAGALSSEETQWLRRCLLYEKSPLAIQMLRQAVGDEAYFASLQEMFGPLATDVSTEAYRRTLEASSHQDLGWFFEDWIERDGLPVVEVHKQVVPAPRGFVVRGQLRQSPGQDFRRIAVPLVLEYADGSKELRLVFQDKPTTDFELPILSPPARIEIDPVHSTLARYR